MAVGTNMTLGVRSKVAVLISAIALGVGGIAAAGMWRIARNHRLARVNTEAHAYAEMTEQRVRRILDNGLYRPSELRPELESLVKELAGLADVDWVEVLDTDSRVLAQSESEGLWKHGRGELSSQVARAIETGETVQSFSDNGREVLIYFPVSRVESESHGRYVVAFAMSTVEMREEFHDQILGYVVLLLSVVGATCLSLLTGLDALVLTPMQRLAAAAEHQESDVSDICARRDEIGVLSRTIMTALDSREERYRLLVEASPYGICEIDGEGQILSMNPAGMEILEISSETSAVGTPYKEFVGRGDWDHLAGSLDGAWRGLSNSFDYCAEDGRAIHSVFVPMRSASGQVIKVMNILMDVSEQKRAERALRESERTLRSIAESSPDLVLVVGLDGAIRFSNRALDRPQEECLGTSIFDYLTGFSQVRLRRCFDQVCESGRPSTLATKYLTADGKLVAFEVRLAPILEGGDLAGIVVAATDVTVRLEAEARFRTFYEHFPLPTFTWKRVGEDFVLESANQAALTVTTGKAEDFYGRKASEVYHDDPEIVRDFEQCFLTRKPIRREMRYRFRSTGLERDLEITYAFVPPDLVMLHTDDITERKAAQEALKRSERSLARAQRIAHLGTWEWEVNAKEGYWSDETFRIFGVDPSEFRPTETAFLGMVHPDDRDRVAHSLRESRDGRALFAHDYRIIRGDGVERIIHGQREVESDDSGKFQKLVGTIQDVTEQRLAERRLTSALEEKDILLREIHHRVKNNLQIITSLLFLQAQKGSDEGMSPILAEMESRVKTMALIHEHLYQSPDLNRVDFRSYLRSLCSSLLSAHRGLPVIIETQADEAFLSIETAMPCGLIVNELVTNAVAHAFPESGGKVRVGFTQEQEDCTLSVEDDGVGLPCEIDVAGSDSLGLRLVSALTEQIRGELDVERARGTRFIIRFTA